jgi:hypothetical protein
MTILNQKYCGDWSGLVLERGSAPPGGPLLLVPVNAVALTIQNFAPPIFPMANAWNSALEKKMPKGMTERLERNFERRTAEFELNQMEVEESAGLGLGITTLLLLSFGWALARKRDSGVPARQDGSGFYWRCLLLSPWVSLLVFLVKCSVGDQSRLIAAYYPLLIPALLMSPFQERIVRARWWRALAFCAVALSLAPLVVSPPRPLWPALSVLEKLDAAHSSKALLRRAHDVYSVYAQRSDAFAPVIKQLPEGLTVLGVIIFDDPEAALWLPIGSRRILHLMPQDTLSDLQQKKIEYVLVRPEVLAKHFPQSLDEWQTSMRAERLTTFPLRLRAALGPIDWILFRVPKAD